MPSQSYRVHIAHQSCVCVELDPQQPSRLLVAELVSAHALAYCDAGGQPIRYSLFDGRERRPLGAERSLAQAALTGGSELYLADECSPWWEQGAEGILPLPGTDDTHSDISQPQRPALAYAASALATVCVVALLWTLRPQAPTAPAATLSRPAPAARATAGDVPTVTLAPHQPVATPPPTPALPTPNPIILAQQAYAQGLQAYDARNWSGAATLFQQVYDLDAGYSDARAKLASSYYGWGLDLLGQGDITGAQTHFEAALRVEPGYGEAQAALGQARQYADARQAAQQGDLDAAIAAYRQLLGHNYANAALELYNTLNERAEHYEQSGGRSNLRAAQALYQEAARLEGLDTSRAQAGLQRLRRLLPTSTPAALAFKAIPAASFAGSGNSGQFASCVSGRVTGRSGAIDGAVLEVNNGPQNRFSATSGGGGYYRVCGLGASTWSVVLFFVPGKPGLGNQPAATIYLNGAPEQQALVNFTQH
jgi:tetratricopeptide (TPR) repeat protein